VQMVEESNMLMHDGSICIRKLAAVCREGYRFHFYQLQLVMGL